MPSPAATSKLFACSLFGALILAGGCDSPADVEPTPRLALMGTVVRADTRAPQPGARVALIRYATVAGALSREVAAEVVADAGGRYTLSHTVAEEGECEELRVEATVDSWQNPNVSSETSRDLECHSGVQQVDVRLVFSGF